MENQTKKILIIDDDQEVVKQVKNILTNNLDCTVDIAYNGKEGLDKMKENVSYDFIILAILIPKLNGIEVCQAMIQNEKLKKIPVLLTSILPLGSEAFRRSLEKFDEFSVVKCILDKPFTDEKLLNEVGKIINSNH